MSGVSKLEAFTGYYAMKGTPGVAPGAFLSIDTTEQQSSKGANANIDVNVSMDGKSLFATYHFSDGGTFDGHKLHIPGKTGALTLLFTREYKDGRLAAFSGTIGSAKVTGDTYFSPVPVSAFVGDYYDATTGKKALSLKSDPKSGVAVLFDFSVLSPNPSGQLQPVTDYSYVPAMFVLNFSGVPGASPAKFMLMLGTASQFGLACSIQDGDTPPKLAPKIVISIP